MEYFLLSQSSKLTNCLTFFDLVNMNSQMFPAQMSHEDFKKLQHSALNFDPDKKYEFPDIVAHPTYMVSDTVRKVLHMYDSSIAFKMVQTMPIYLEQVKADLPVYWIYDCEHIDCTTDDTIVLPNGELENIVIDYKKVMGKDIFRIEKMLANKLVVSLPVVESLLRREIYGVEILPLKMV